MAIDEICAANPPPPKTAVRSTPSDEGMWTNGAADGPSFSSM